MKHNGKPKVVDIIALSQSSNNAYNELKAKYEGKIVTDLEVILANIVHLMYNDRNNSIEEHVTEFDKR